MLSSLTANCYIETSQVVIHLVTRQQQQQLYFFHPKIYKKEKFIIIVQTMIGALAARNNLRVKNARQPVERKDV